MTTTKNFSKPSILHYHKFEIAIPANILFIAQRVMLCLGIRFTFIGKIESYIPPTQVDFEDLPALITNEDKDDGDDTDTQM